MVHTTASVLAWNLFVGGIDAGDDSRRRKQIAYMASCADVDFYWITEATRWTENGGRPFRELAVATNTVHLPPVTSVIGDRVNHSCLFYRPSRVKELHYSELARGAFHHGTARATFEVDGRPLLILGTHLAYADGDSRMQEAHHLADYARKFGDWPEEAALIGDMNMPDDNDPEPDWDQVPQNLWHRLREILPDGSFGPLHRGARGMLLNSGWRDPQKAVAEVRAPTTGYWWQNELVPMRIDQALVTGPRLKVTGYRTHDTPALRTLTDHLPAQLDIELHDEPLPEQ